MAINKLVSHMLPVFHFLCVDKNFDIKEIRNLGINKATQDTDVTVWILKENPYFFAKIVKNLKVPEYKFGNTFYQRIKLVNFHSSSENKDHLSMAIGKLVSHILPVFYILCVDKNFAIKEIRNLGINKATQDI